MTEQGYRVGVIVGSASEQSLNRQYAEALQRLGDAAGLAFVDIPIVQLPFYGTHFDADYPDVGVEFKSALAGVDGLLIVTPEYNRSIPGVLKNAIDWATRPGGESVLPGLPTAITGASKGAISTALAQAHLSTILIAQGTPVLGAPEAYIRIGDEFFDDDGGIASEGTREFLTGFLKDFRALIARWR